MAMGNVIVKVAVLFGVGVAAGRALARHPLAAESRLNEAMACRRSPARDSVAVPVSWLTDVPRAIIGTLGWAGAAWALTKDARAAVRPLTALGLAAGLHVASSAVVGRPRPGVEKLGTMQVTSSFPSGHVGAATAACVTIADAAAGLPGAPRALVRTMCVAFPLAVGWSRLYTGQHYASDILMGYANGIGAARCARDIVAATKSGE